MAKQSLAAEKGVVVPATPSLPAIFTAPQDAMKARFIAPYLTFAHPKRADEWKRIQAKYSNLEEGDVFLMRQDSVLALPVAKLGYLCGKQYWAIANGVGEIQKVSYEERPKPYKEHIDAVVLVYLENEVVPANVSFRSTKCPAGKALSDALLKAATPEWADGGQAFKDSLIVQQPFGRFYGECSLGDKRPSKETGLPYRVYNCVIKPTSTPEWQLLKPFFEDPASAKKLEDAAQRFSYRQAEMQKKAG